MTFNSAAHIGDCVERLRQRPSWLRVGIRDNASSDGTPTLLKELQTNRFVDSVVLDDENVGFAVAVNEIIRDAGDDDVILLNPDARIDIDAILAMRNEIEQDRTLGLVAPVVLGASDIKVMSAGRQPRLWPMFTHYSGLSAVFPHVGAFKGRHLFIDPHSNDDQFVEWTSGCCVYIPRRTINDIGMLSEAWFMYGEDVEFCSRVLNGGKRIKILSRVRAYHEVGGSSSASPTSQEASDVHQTAAFQSGRRESVNGHVSTLWARNLYDFYRREYRPSIVTAFVWKLVFTFGNLSRAMIRALRDADRRRAKGLARNALAVWR
ncbi:glycosyltransferase [Pseudonocardia sp.]|uniref:glycosyltransferase n=1 Tax=Pseudonocardia sp. TaxID=60912 RepID=UPI003D142982